MREILLLPSSQREQPLFLPKQKLNQFSAYVLRVLAASLWIVLSCISFSLFAQNPVREWDKKFGGDQFDRLSVTIQTPDGGYLLGGYSDSGFSGDKTQPSKGGTDFWLVKTDASGNKLWDKAYGGGGSDTLTSLIPTADGGYLLGGNSQSDIGGDKSENRRKTCTTNPANCNTASDYWVIKIDGSGNKQWDKTIGGKNTDQLTTILPASDGGYLLAGTSYSGQEDDHTASSFGSPHYWIVKLNSSGVKLWDKSFSGTAQNYLTSAVIAPDGGFLLGGNSNSNASGDKAEAGFGALDYWVVKTDASGNKQWDKTFGGTETDLLVSVVGANDGGYLLAGTSRSSVSGNKTSLCTECITDDPSINQHLWLVKINSTGAKQWEQTSNDSRNSNRQLFAAIGTSDGGYLLAIRDRDFEGFRSTGAGKLDAFGNPLWRVVFSVISDDLTFDYDDLYTLLQTSDRGYLLGGGSDEYVLLKTGPDSITPPSCTATGNLLREVWNNVSGEAVSTIPVNTAPTSSNFITAFETPNNIGDRYGQRLRGYICVPVTGNYTFYLSGDNHAELWLSTDETVANKQRIAYISGTNAYSFYKQWTKYPSQQSISISLQAGRRYYVEALHKEAYGGDQVAVGWKKPGSTTIEVIPGSVLSEYVYSCTASGTILQEVWNNISGEAVSTIPVNTAPSSSNFITAFETPNNIGDRYGQRLRGYICVPVTGNYTFYLSGDNHAELWLSTDETVANKQRIAYISGTNAYSFYKQWTKYPSQQSVSILLERGKTYYVEVLHKEAFGGDQVAVGWKRPESFDIEVIPGAVLSPYVNPTARLAFSQEQQGGRITAFPNPFTDRFSIQTYKSGKQLITLFDALGRVVYQGSQVADGQELSVDLTSSSLKQGMYMVRIQAEDGTRQLIKMIKQ